MSNQNLIGVYLKQEDEDLREMLKGYDNAAKAELVKKALRVYLANEKPLMARITSAPGKPWSPFKVNKGGKSK